MALYRARWQIELFFKRLKQCLHLHQLRHQDWERASSVVQLYLIVWWLQEQEAQWMREVLTSVLEPLAEDVCEVSEGEGEPEEEQDWVVSSWTLAHVCGEQVRTMLRGASAHSGVPACLTTVRAQSPAQARALRERTTRLAAIKRSATSSQESIQCLSPRL